MLVWCRFSCENWCLFKEPFCLKPFFQISIDRILETMRENYLKQAQGIDSRRLFERERDSETGCPEAFQAFRTRSHAAIVALASVQKKSRQLYPKHGTQEFTFFLIITDGFNEKHRFKFLCGAILHQRGQKHWSLGVPFWSGGNLEVRPFRAVSTVECEKLTKAIF